ncbi:MAG: hypothetical protein ACM31D_08300 [Bacteroidota bacterium]
MSVETPAMAPDMVPTMDEVKASLQRLAWKALPKLNGVDIPGDQRLSILGMSSLEVMCVIFEVEEEFELSIVSEGLDDFETFDEMAALVHNLLVRKRRHA